jgi:drug/metabolite transporter (DMT)-like permease
VDLVQQQKMLNKIKSKLTNPVVVCLLAGFCCLLWGSAFPVIKIGYSLLSIDSSDYMSQILFAGVRFTLAGVLTLIFGSIVSKDAVKIKKAGLYKIPVLALFQTILQYLFFYIGLAKTTGTKSSILDATSVFFSVLIATLVLHQEKLTVKKLVGCVLGFAGVIVVNLSNGGIDTSMSFTGEGFIVLSALSYAVSSVMIKQFTKNDNPVALSGYQFVLGGIVMIAVGFAFGGRLNINSIKPVLIVLYLALLSAVAYTVWGILLKFNDVSKVTVFGFMTPVFGCILSAILLGERLADSGIKTLVALVLVCTGIYVVNNSRVK